MSKKRDAGRKKPKAGKAKDKAKGSKKDGLPARGAPRPPTDAFAGPAGADLGGVPEDREPLYDDCGLDLPPASAYAWAGPAPRGLTGAQAAELERLAGRLFAHLSGHRLAHSMSVARTAGRLAAAHGVDPFLAQAAGLLHDWDKRLSPDELWDKAARYGVLPPEGRDERLTSVLHGRTAAASLPELFDELPPEVFRAIGRHTVGAVDMGGLDAVVYCADFLEPLRGPDVDPLRALTDGDLEGLFAACARQSLIFVLATGRYLGLEGVEVWNAYESRLPETLRGRRCRILFEDVPQGGHR